MRSGDELYFFLLFLVIDIIRGGRIVLRIYRQDGGGGVVLFDIIFSAPVRSSCDLCRWIEQTRGGEKEKERRGREVRVHHVLAIWTAWMIGGVNNNSDATQI